jgi:hypothetical protein
VCDLFRKPFLHLESARVNLSNPSELGEANYMVIRDVSDMHLFDG